MEVSGGVLPASTYFGVAIMAKGKSSGRESVWLQCSETGDLNYRTEIQTKGGISEKVKGGFKKYCPRLRKHTLHKIKRK